MSYILNALKKSERERLAQQAATITGKILVDESQPPKKSKSIILLLIVSNAVIALILIWFLSNNTNQDVSEKQMELAKKLTNNAEKDLTELTEQTISKQTTKPPSYPDSQSISAMVDAVKMSNKEALKSKAAMKKKAEMDQIKKEPAKLVQPEDNNATKQAESKPIETESESSFEEFEHSAPKPGKHTAIPFVHELPAGIRQSLPDLKINVFVYSDQPEERFVMINMVKYQPGQRINDSVLLKEIRSNAMILESQGVKFQIKRP